MVARSSIWPALLLSLIASGAVAQPTPGTLGAGATRLPEVPRPHVELQSWDEAMRLLGSHSPDLADAGDELARAEAESTQALARLLPNVTAMGVATHRFISRESAQIVGVTADNPPTPIFEVFRTPTVDALQGSIRLVQPVLDFGLIHGYRSAQRRAGAAALSSQDALRRMVYRTAAALFDVITGERIAELNRNGLESANSRAELTRQRRAIGAATDIDVIRAEQDARRAHERLLFGDEILRQTRESLGLVLGLPTEVGVKPELRLSALVEAANRSCQPVPELERRADIVAARQRVEAAALGVSQARSQYLPTVTLQSTVSTTTVDTGAVPRTLLDVEGVLSIPIWDSGARLGALRGAESVEQQAVHQLARLRNTATIDLHQAARAKLLTEEARELALQLRNLAAQNDTSIRQAYHEGRASSLELVVSASELRDAEIALAIRDSELAKSALSARLMAAECQL